MGKLTFFLGDLHLTDAEAGPGARAYKRPEVFRDEQLCACIDWMAREHDESRLVLTGDVFDLDLVVLEEAKDDQKADAAAKLSKVIHDHPELIEALARLARAGRLHWLMGNHDLEMVLPDVRQTLAAALDEREPGAFTGLQFHGWAMHEPGVFWAEHGHVYDPYACVPDPLDPSLDNGVYYPFGCLVNQELSNRLTSFNPQSDSQVLQGLLGYLRHWIRYDAWPPWSMPLRYLRGAILTYSRALSQLRRSPGLPGPDDLARRVSAQIGATAEQALLIVEKIARPIMHQGRFEPLRTLWLDRAVLLPALAVGAAAGMVAGGSIAGPALWPLLAAGIYMTYEWMLGPSKAEVKTGALPEAAINAAEAMDVPFAVFGHAHEPTRVERGDRTYLNAGSWAPIYKDAECTRRADWTDTLAMIEHGDGPARASLLKWQDGPVEID